jgi:antibiotic biosynthesis monooxygenase (ABM) superfamily enzyme
MEPLVLDTRVQRVHGVEEFFELPGLVVPHRSWYRRMFGDIAWVFPVSLVVSLLVSPHLAFLPLAPRVLAIVTLMTITMSFAVQPVRDRLRLRVRSTRI